jgi:hypothetical protein
MLISELQDLTMDISDINLENRNGKRRCEIDVASVAGPSKKARVQEGNMTVSWRALSTTASLEDDH